MPLIILCCCDSHTISAQEVDLDGEDRVEKEELLPKQIHPHNFLQKWQNIFSIADWSARNFLQFDRSFRGSLIRAAFGKDRRGVRRELAWHRHWEKRPNWLLYLLNALDGDKENPFVRYQRGIVIINGQLSAKLQRSPGMKMSSNAFAFTLFKIFV